MRRREKEGEREVAEQHCTWRVSKEKRMLKTRKSLPKVAKNLRPD